jgi:hypothetical protein
MYVLTTISELPKQAVIMALDHIFYEPKKKDVIMNYATLCANWERLIDVTDQLGWGEHQVFMLSD